MSSINRLVEIMELLARKSPMGVRSIAQNLKLPLGSVHRLLLEMERENITERNANGDWEMSFRLFEITGRLLTRLDFPALVRPFAENIAAATGETVNLNLFRGMATICIDKYRGNEGMQLDWPIGSRGPLYCGGAGKAMLAYLGPQEQAQILSGELKTYTSHTLTDPARLQQEIDRIRARGYSIDDQELVLGVYCVAVPILDRTARPLGAISITGPSVKSPGEKIAPLVDLLNEAAGGVSRRLGYTGDWPCIIPAPSDEPKEA